MIGLVYFVFLRDFDFSKIFSVFKKENVSTTEITRPNPVPPKNDEGKGEKKPLPRRIIIGENSEESNTEDENPAEVTAEDLTRIAAAFAERFGSYSNQSNFGNVTDLEVFMSNKMRNWSVTFVSQQRERLEDTSEYYGITTKAAAKEIKDYDEELGIAVILVHTRRREIMSDSHSGVFDQDIEISFVKEREAWKVDSANWLDK